MATSNVVFLFILILAAAVFSFSAQRLLRFLNLGKAENRLNAIPKRIANLLKIGFAQTKILRDPIAGPLHALVFWGFVVLQLGAIEILISGVFPSFSYATYLPAPIHALFLLTQELTTLAVLAAVSVLLYRRIVVKPKRLQGDHVHGGDAILILSLIAALMVTLLLTSATDRLLTHRFPIGVQPFSAAMSMLLAPIPVAALGAIHSASFYSHAI